MKKLALILAVAMATVAAQAEVKLPSYFNENMVMQQNQEMSIPAKARGGAKVKITPSWTGKTVTAKADKKGNFTINLTAPAAGGPYSITFDDGDVTTIGNLLSGEVWLCSGQSNMEFPVAGGWGSVYNKDEVVALATKPTIRLFQVRKTMAFEPQEDVNVSMNWCECTPATVQNFSSVAYLFACQLADSLNVPVGVIDTSWGGTPAEAWTSFGSIKEIPGFERETKRMSANKFERDAIQKAYDKEIEDWFKSCDRADKNLNPAEFHPEWETINAPRYIENVEPWLDGVTWYQKEIDVPADWAGKSITIHLGPIDDDDDTYFNGKKIGSTSGFNVPRHYTIPGELVKAGKNLITICNSDFSGEGGFGGNANDMYAESYGSRIGLDGEWKYLVGADFRTLPAKPLDINSSSHPTVLYNAMIAPLRHLPVKGFLWYQGCANVGRDKQYAQIMKAMVNDWRKDWGKPLPFYFVQLAGYLQPQYLQPNSEWAALRNAQLAVLDLENTGVAVAIDLGHPTDIHPRNKQDVAARLARIALNRDYGHDVDYLAPAVVSSEVKGNKMVVSFDASLRTANPALLGFIIGDGKGNWAQATGRYIDDKTIELWANTIKKPVAVRYDWADYPNGNIYGVNGLPVVPFATDKKPGE